MSLSDFFQNLWHKESHHLVCTHIPESRQSPSVKPTVAKAEKHYFRVWLAEMFLCDDRRLFREYVPVVHSVVRLQFADKPTQELPYVAGPQDIGLGTTLGKGVQLNHYLTNLLPFKGGTVSVSAGLFAYKSKDFFQNLSSILHDVTGLLNQGQLSSALKIVDSAVDGIQGLLGAGDKDLHLLLYQGFGGDTGTGGVSLTSGYITIIDAQDNKFDSSKLFVKESRLCYGDSLATATSLEGYDYMLLRLEVCDSRDDYLTFEVFSNLLRDAIREGTKDRAAGDAIIKTAAIAAWSSPDLTVADRFRVAKGLRAYYEEVVGQEQLASAVDPDAIKKALNTQILSISASHATDAANRLFSAGELHIDRFLKDVL